MSLFSRSKLSSQKRATPRVVSGLDHTKGTDYELVPRGVSKDRWQNSCVLCVGSKSSGKSSTINLFNLSLVDSSNDCTLYRPEASVGPSWVEIADWDLASNDTEDSFHEALELLLAHGITKIQAILWHVIPAGRPDDMILYEQARFINMFKPRDIWSNVIIVAKLSMNPGRDGREALKNALAFAPKDTRISLQGYRFLEDASLSAADKEKFTCPETRTQFNVKSKAEVKELLETEMDNLEQVCSLDDDEKHTTLLARPEVKTVFGLPPLVFPKPF